MQFVLSRTRKFIPRQRSTMPVRCTTVSTWTIIPLVTTRGLFALCGRITMEKGTHVAIEVAQQLDRKLIIAAKLV